MYAWAVMWRPGSRLRYPQAWPMDNLDDACLAATLQPMHTLTTLV